MEDSDMQELVDQVAEKCLLKLRQERSSADQTQLEQMNTLLEHWSDNSFERTKELVSTMSASASQDASKNSANISSVFAETTADMKDRQSNLLTVRYLISWIFFSCL